MEEAPWTRFAARQGLAPRDDAAHPVFVLAAGWRSGSTLVQRLLCSSKEVLIWGEAYGRAGLVQSLTATAMGLNEQWPTPGHFGTESVFANLSDNWIANLYPPPDAMREALGAPLETLLAWPAAERGFDRFGLKEVRLQAAHARFLEWIYPSARFVFLVRNPWDAWRSARGLGLMAHWAGPVMDHPQKFAAHWARLAASYLSWDQENGCLLKYEDLRSTCLKELAAHCRLGTLDVSVLARVQTGVNRPTPEPLSAAEVEVIRTVAGPLAQKFGYTGPTRARMSA